MCNRKTSWHICIQRFNFIKCLLKDFGSSSLYKSVKGDSWSFLDIPPMAHSLFTVTGVIPMEFQALAVCACVSVCLNRHTQWAAETELRKLMEASAQPKSLVRQMIGTIFHCFIKWYDGQLDIHQCHQCWWRSEQDTLAENYCHLMKLAFKRYHVGHRDPASLCALLFKPTQSSSHKTHSFGPVYILQLVQIFPWPHALACTRLQVVIFSRHITFLPRDTCS